MANTPQAKKRIRRNERRAEINGARVSRIRGFLKKVETAIEGGDQKQAAEALRAAQPELARGCMPTASWFCVPHTRPAACFSRRAYGQTRSRFQQRRTD